MSNKLIADLMSFRARMVADNRTQLMFEGDFDTIDQAIATLRKATITSPQQVSQSEPVAEVIEDKLADWSKPHATVKWHQTDFPIGTKFYAAPQQAIPSGLIESAQALLDLDANNALVPHGIGGLARSIIERFIALSVSPTAPIESDQ